MKYTAQFLIALAVCGIQAGSVPKTQRGIAASSLSTTPVIGNLGLPIGNVVLIQCHLAANPEVSQNKVKSGDPYQLAVTQIDDKQLDTPINVNFKVSRESQKEIPINSTPIGFAEMQTAGTKMRPTSQMGVQLAKKWMGRSFNCIAYETGSFTGHPRYRKHLAPRMIVATRGFHFSSHIVLIHPSHW